MTVSIHQPNFIPWIGYFYKISRSDVFVILDDVQYTKNSFINRNKIKTANGANWLTMPVVAGKLSQAINETHYFEKNKNVQKIKKTIELNYRKSRFFNEYYDPFCDCLDYDSDIVSEFNANILFWINAQFDINTEIVFSSGITDIEGISTDRLVAICKAVGGDTYLSGTGGANYQEEELFKANRVKLAYSDFVHPAYDQLYGGFLPYMSAIDYLFNVGPATREFFKSPDQSTT